MRHFKKKTISTCIHAFGDMKENNMIKLQTYQIKYFKINNKQYQQNPEESLWCPPVNPTSPDQYLSYLKLISLCPPSLFDHF